MPLTVIVYLSNEIICAAFFFIVKNLVDEKLILSLYLRVQHSAQIIVLNFSKTENK